MRRRVHSRASGYAAFMSPAADSIHRLHEHRLWTRAKILAAARTCTDAELHRPFEMGMGLGNSALAGDKAMAAMYGEGANKQYETGAANAGSFTNLVGTGLKMYAGSGGFGGIFGG